MSTHPNALLILTLTPHGLARKTMRDILVECGLNVDDSYERERDVKIDGVDYHHKIMESTYDEGWQISSKEGDLLFFDLITYGYGEKIPWNKLNEQKDSLETWARGICERHHCDYEISISANYW